MVFEESALDNQWPFCKYLTPCACWKPYITHVITAEANFDPKDTGVGGMPPQAYFEVVSVVIPDSNIMYLVFRPLYCRICTIFPELQNAQKFRKQYTTLATVFVTIIWIGIAYTRPIEHSLY